MSPEPIVQKQLETYNARDLAGFVACYHPEVELFNFPEQKPFSTGLGSLEERYREVFDQSPELHAHIERRIVFDNKVIDHERVTGRKGIEEIQIIAIYEVEEQLIRRVYFIWKS